MKYYIYIITNVVNNKKYVGCSKDPKRRIYQHLNGRCSVEIKEDLNKYSKEDFTTEIIPYFGASEEAMKAIEQWQIQKNNSFHPNGYNLETGGNKDKQICEKSKNKMVAAQIGRKIPDETVKNMSEGSKSQLWTFRHEILCLRNIGFTYTKLAEIYNCGTETMRQLCIS